MGVVYAVRRYTLRWSGDWEYQTVYKRVQWVWRTREEAEQDVDRAYFEQALELVDDTWLANATAYYASDDEFRRLCDAWDIPIEVDAGLPEALVQKVQQLDFVMTIEQARSVVDIFKPIEVEEIPIGFTPTIQ